jgi:hypothetical protein
MPTIEKTAKIDAQARRFCTHTIVYTETLDQRVAMLALQGLSTRGIMLRTGMTYGEVQYRVLKAQHSLGRRFRADYRTGQGDFVNRLLKAGQHLAQRYVAREIAPKFVAFARRGVPRM